MIYPWEVLRRLALNRLAGPHFTAPLVIDELKPVRGLVWSISWRRIFWTSWAPHANRSHFLGASVPRLRNRARRSSSSFSASRQPAPREASRLSCVGLSGRCALESFISVRIMYTPWTSAAAAWKSPGGMFAGLVRSPSELRNSYEVTWAHSKTHRECRPAVR